MLSLYCYNICNKGEAIIKYFEFEFEFEFEFILLEDSLGHLLSLLAFLIANLVIANLVITITI